MAPKNDFSGAAVILEIEKSRIEREKAKIVLNNGLLLYFVFLIIAVVGFAFEFIDAKMLKILVICGIAILIISTIPYVVIFRKEEKFIKKKLSEIKK